MSDPTDETHPTDEAKTRIVSWRAVLWGSAIGVLLEWLILESLLSTPLAGFGNHIESGWQLLAAALPGAIAGGLVTVAGSFIKFVVVKSWSAMRRRHEKKPVRHRRKHSAI
jgi:hypothetical protein